MTCEMSHLTWALPRNRWKTVPSHLPVFHWHLDYSQWQEYHHGQNHHAKYSCTPAWIKELDRSWPGSCNSGFSVFFWTCIRKKSLFDWYFPGVIKAENFLLFANWLRKLFAENCAQSFDWWLEKYYDMEGCKYCKIWIFNTLQAHGGNGKVLLKFKLLQLFKIITIFIKATYVFYKLFDAKCYQSQR